MPERFELGMVPGDTVPAESSLRSKARRLVTSSTFDVAIGFVILANSLTIGIEQSFEIEGMSTSTLENLEHVFLGVYVLELAARFAAYGVQCLKDNWVKFDGLLVVVGIFRHVDPPSLAWKRGGAGASHGAANDAAGTPCPHGPLAGEVQGLVDAGVGAPELREHHVLHARAPHHHPVRVQRKGIELIANNPLAGTDPEFQEVAQLYFSTLPGTMLTLMQFVCLDTIGAIYRPLVEKDGILAIYFTAIIVIVPVVLMNLVTAVIVGGALEQSQQDKEGLKLKEEQKTETLVQRLRTIFQALDEDNSGEVSREEIANINESDEVVLCSSTPLKHPVEIFNALDIDGTGAIGIEDFCHVFSKVASSDTPLETQRMTRQVNVILKRVKELCSAQEGMQEKLGKALRTQQGLERALLARRARADFEGSDRAEEGPGREEAPAPPVNWEEAPAWAQGLLSHLRSIRKRELPRPPETNGNEWPHDHKLTEPALEPCGPPHSSRPFLLA
eukprot:CAMPEP_0179088158 /NCGR_PEP_ID=MMETSP0796-20121207/40096_1 /TAXON_ID=73915 /ORGANISM="Pyrodinium bahamense, Strain pbaha01" /LENGTH=501 /DNA_ID=CAMNT_0020785681 /DNA_START=77 /DNA_END=1583 /DNA_ORIENTATION=+